MANTKTVVGDSWINHKGSMTQNLIKGQNLKVIISEIPYVKTKLKYQNDHEESENRGPDTL